MNLYFIRHAIAEPLGQRNEFSDEKRTLTKKGRDRMRDVARGLRKLGVEFDLILTSPLVRAFETAEILAEFLGIDKKEIGTRSALAPDGSAELVIAEIKASAAASIAMVGHQPHLGSLASRIIQGDNSTAIQLKKGGVCCINVVETVPALRGELVWLLTSKQLRLLARRDRMTKVNSGISKCTF